METEEKKPTEEVQENVTQAPGDCEASTEIEGVILSEETSASQSETGVAEAMEQSEVTTDVIEQEEPAQNEQNNEKTKKKLNVKVLLIALGSVAALAVIVFVIVFFAVIRPNSIYEEASQALKDGDYLVCQQLLDEIPKHKKTPALQRKLTLAIAESYIENDDLDLAETTLASLPGDAEAKKLKDKITYLRAANAVAHGQYADAKTMLDKIPNYQDKDQLREQIRYQEALDALGVGNYEMAYEIFSQLGDYSDAPTQKETVYYEALALRSLFNIQDSLKNPASLRVTKVTFYKDSGTEGELDAIYEITASNSYGGSVGGYVLDLSIYEGSDPSLINHSDYVDPDDYYELLAKYTIDAVKSEKELKTTVDVARMNRLISENATFKIDLPFQSETVVEN